LYKMIEAKERYIPIKDYATKMNVSVKTVYNWIDSGKIPKKNIKKVLSTTLIKL
jgi:predicted DNA-binding transcriptional regulator AlpA